MFFQLLVLSAIQFPFTGRGSDSGSDNALASGKELPMVVPYKERHDYKTHIISFYGVKGSVTDKAIQGISSTLIVIYEEKPCLVGLDPTNRIKHHFHESSAALIEILEFWPKLLAGLCTVSLKERNEKIEESVEYVKTLLDGIDTKIYQRVMYKMTEDGFGGHFEHVYPFWSKDKIEKVMVFYKHAFEDIYELVRKDYVRWVSRLPKSQRGTAVEKVNPEIWNNLIDTVPNLICDAMTHSMQVSITADLSKLAEAAVNLNALINGAMIKQQICEWKKYGLLKRLHVDIYFNALHPMPAVLGPKDTDFQVVKHCVKIEGAEMNSNKVESFPDYFDNGHYKAMLREYALQHSRMMRLVTIVKWCCRIFSVIFVLWVIYLLTLM